MSLQPARPARLLANPFKSYVCKQCQQRRTITQNWLRRQDDAAKQWTEFAVDIRRGKRKSLYNILNERGLIHDVAGDRTAFENLLIDKRVGFYSGVDPTATSLHVGHILPMMPLFWAHFLGCQAVSLIGGSTAKVGDPTGRTTTRPIMTATERKANMVCLNYQLKKIWLNAESLARRLEYNEADNYRLRGIVNNNTWHNKTPFQEIVNGLGSGLRMSTLLGRDTVKNKMESGEGMSFSEFCYPLYQAWDWWVLYDTRKIQIQVGGQDQFGNIMTGMECVKHMAGTHPHVDHRKPTDDPLFVPFGMTVPLLTTSSGEKFGKSAGNAVWLDDAQTSQFDLYGFFMRTSDADVKKYLRLFTFISMEEIDKICATHEQDPSKREAQHRLAYEFIYLVHGHQAAIKVAQQHRDVFSKRSVSSLLDSTAETIESQQIPPESPESPESPKADAANPWTNSKSPKKRQLSTFENREFNPFAQVATANNQGAKRIVLPKSLVYNQSVSKVFCSAGLVGSRSEGHRLIASKGAYFGHRSGKDPTMSDDLTFKAAKSTDPSQTWTFVIHDHTKDGTMEGDGEEGLMILRVGKWKVRVVRIVSDEKFETLELPDPPLWAERKAEMAAERWEQGDAEDQKRKRDLIDDMFSQGSRPKAEKSAGLEDEIDVEEDDAEDKPGWSAARKNDQRARLSAIQYLQKDALKKADRDQQNGREGTFRIRRH